MQSHTFSLPGLSRLWLLIVGCVVTLLGAGFAHTARAATFEISSVVVDKFDVYGNSSEDVRSFAITFSSLAKDIDLEIFQGGSLFYQHTSAGSTQSIYISTADGTKKLSPNTTYQYSITANAATAVTGDASDFYLGEFTTSNFVPSKPDIIVDRIEYSQHPQVNEDRPIDVYFKNIGGPVTTNAHNWNINPLFDSSTFVIGSTFDAFSGRVFSTNPWQTGETLHVEVYGHFTHTGQQQITAMYDNDNGIVELDETNNAKSAWVFVQPALKWELIKSSSSPSVYWYSWGYRTRHAFPNERTYFSWFSSFNNIRTITDVEMATIPIGTNVRIKPGTTLVKVVSDPKVYALDVANTLRWITTESLAAQLYGTDWSKKVVDIDPTLFGNYSIGSNITLSTDYSVSNVLAQTTSIEQVLR